MKDTSAFPVARSKNGDRPTVGHTMAANARRLDAYQRSGPQAPEEAPSADTGEETLTPLPLGHNTSNIRTPVARPRLGRTDAVAAWRSAMRARPMPANLGETAAQGGVLERQVETMAQAPAIPGTPEAQSIQDLERRRDSLRQELAHQELSWTRFLRGIEHARQEQYALQADVMELSQRAHALHAQIAEMVSLRDDMERQLCVQQDHIGRGMASAIQAGHLLQELADIERRREALRNEASQQEAKNREMNARRQALQERIAALEGQQQTSEATLAAAERRRTELQPAVAELERLRSEVERLTRERDALAIAIAGLKVQQATLSGQAQHLSAEVETHEREKASQLVVLETLRQQVQDIGRREQALRAEMDGLGARRDALAVDAATLETRNAGLARKAQDLEHLTRALEEKRSSLEEQVSRLQAKRQTLEGTAPEPRESDLAQRVADLERRARELEERRLRLESQVASLEAGASETAARA
ncbi:MAG: hypothetical protein HY681_02595 [Chloroflexi bacterium]|nr:hypothetical protein [Chloroflexota bacterium]